MTILTQISFGRMVVRVGAVTTVAMVVALLALRTADAAPQPTVCTAECSQFCFEQADHRNMGGEANTGPTHSCEQFGTGSDCPHDTCANTLGSPEIRRIYAAVQGNNLDEVADMLLKPGVFLNVERGAIQVVGCKGAVIAHIPVSPLQVAELDD